MFSLRVLMQIATDLIAMMYFITLRECAFYLSDAIVLEPMLSLMSLARLTSVFY